MTSCTWPCPVPARFLPDSCDNGTQRYPVLFGTDANDAFPIVRNIAQRLHRHAGKQPPAFDAVLADRR